MADVPSGEGWLGDAERRALAGMPFQRRRSDWLLGRWTAKAAVGDWLGVSPARIQILAAADGAPEAWLDRERMAVSVSLSHRGGRAVAAVADRPLVIGCDLEMVEPRSDAFVREWLSCAEQHLVASASGSERPLLANLIWAAKEAVSKVRRGGLRLNFREAVVTAQLDSEPGEWRPLTVEWRSPTAGWWRAEPGWVLVVAGQPELDPPRMLRCEGSA